MKVAKEQIIGMVAAVDWFLEQTDEGMQAEFRRRAERIAAHLKDIPTLRTEVFVPPLANAIPHLLIRYDRARLPIAPLEVAEKLRRGTPAIELNLATGHKSGSAGLPDATDAIIVGVWMLQPGEDMIVAAKLRETLKSAV
jgi:L-seryl-tRNA(Ser) seleniumtransferase